MKTIIVPTDFSPVARNAAEFAVDMAAKLQARIILMNVYNIPVAYSGDVPVMLLSVDELRKASETQLETLANNLKGSGNISIETVAMMGNTVDELQKASEKYHPFAIIMGAHGKSGIENAVFGSTTLSAIRHLEWPVIAVPPQKKFGAGIKKIGFACDFKKIEDNHSFRMIREIVKEIGAELHVLNVDYKEKHFRPDTPAESFKLHELLKDLSPEYHFIENEDIEDGIHEFADNNNLDLVIAIPKKHKLLDSIFKPSSTRQLVFHSHVPVMCIHE